MATPTLKSGILKALLILHKAMLAGQLIFLLLSFYLVYTNSITESLQYLDHVLQVVAIACSVGGFYIGTVLFKRKLLAAKEMHKNPKEKLAVYKQGCILQWALMEGPCLFVIICFLFTGNYAFLALAVILLLPFAMMAPSKLKIVFHLQISEDEITGL